MTTPTYKSLKHNLKSINISTNTIQKEIKILHESVASSINKVNRYCDHHPEIVQLIVKQNETIRKIKSIELHRSQLLNEALDKYTNVSSIYGEMRKKMKKEFKDRHLHITDKDHLYAAIYVITKVGNDQLRNLLNQCKTDQELNNLKCNKLRVRIINNDGIFEIYHPFISTCCFAEEIIKIADKDIIISFNYPIKLKHKLIINNWFRELLHIRTITVISNIIIKYSELINLSSTNKVAQIDVESSNHHNQLERIYDDQGCYLCNR